MKTYTLNTTIERLGLDEEVEIIFKKAKQDFDIISIRSLNTNKMYSSFDGWGSADLNDKLKAKYYEINSKPQIQAKTISDLESIANKIFNCSNLKINIQTGLISNYSIEIKNATAIKYKTHFGIILTA